MQRCAYCIELNISVKFIQIKNPQMLGLETDPFLGLIEASFVLFVSCSNLLLRKILPKRHVFITNTVYAVFNEML